MYVYVHTYIYIYIYTCIFLFAAGCRCLLLFSVICCFLLQLAAWHRCKPLKRTQLRAIDVYKNLSATKKEETPLLEVKKCSIILED